MTLDPACRELLAAIGAALDLEPKPRAHADLGPWLNRLRDRAAVVRMICETVLASEHQQAERARQFAGELRQLIARQGGRPAEPEQ
jgi:hypothetical protein